MHITVAYKADSDLMKRFSSDKPIYHYIYFYFFFKKGDQKGLFQL